jgi:hypothetical protein
VLALDIAGLRMLLGGTGPVDASGTVVSTDNVVQLLMHDQYLGETGDPASSRARREELGSIASSVVQAIQRGGFNTSAVAKELPLVVAGRHLMLWSDRASTETAWREVGVAGALTADTLLAAVQNVGVNKLDRFLTLSSEVRVVPGSPTRVTVVFHLVNQTPPGEPGYIAGIGVGGVPPNTYYALATLTMPGDARQVLVDGAPVANNSGLDGPTRVVAALRKVAPGGHGDLTVTFTLPLPHGRLQVESAARVPSATVSVQTTGPSQTSPDDLRPAISW